MHTPSFFVEHLKQLNAGLVADGFAHGASRSAKTSINEETLALCMEASSVTELYYTSGFQSRRREHCMCITAVNHTDGAIYLPERANGVKR